MPMYLGDTKVEGLYLGDNPIGRYAVGSTQGDIDAVKYEDPAIASKYQDWTVTGTGSGQSASAGVLGVELVQGSFSGDFNAKLDVGDLVVGRTYRIEVKISDSLPWDGFGGAISQGGVQDGASAQAPLDSGDTYDYTFDCTDSDFSFEFFHFTMYAGAVLYVESVMLTEVY